MKNQMASEESLLGKKVGQYQIESIVGKGGYATVYKALHVKDDQHVAIKLLRDDRRDSDPNAHARFLREAEAISSLGHPNVVSVYDSGTFEEGQAFLAMELLEGRELKHLLEEKKKLPVEHACSITMQILSALMSVHERKIIHRDLKPSNIFVTEMESEGSESRAAESNPQVKILDFGISKAMEEAQEQSLTLPGLLMGTPQYMAPEQLWGSKSIDHRVDLYAVAVMLFEMLSGHRPQEADNKQELIVKIMTTPPMPLLRVAPHVPHALSQVLAKGLAKDPDLRWGSAKEFAEALERVFDPDKAEALEKELPSLNAPTGQFSRMTIPEEAVDAMKRMSQTHPHLITKEMVRRITGQMPVVTAEDIRKLQEAGEDKPEVGDTMVDSGRSSQTFEIKDPVSNQGMKKIKLGVLIAGLVLILVAIFWWLKT